MREDSAFINKLNLWGNEEKKPHKLEKRRVLKAGVGVQSSEK